MTAWVRMNAWLYKCDKLLQLVEATSTFFVQFFFLFFFSSLLKYITSHFILAEGITQQGYHLKLYQCYFFYKVYRKMDKWNHEESDFYFNFYFPFIDVSTEGRRVMFIEMYRIIQFPFMLCSMVKLYFVRCVRIVLN